MKSKKILRYNFVTYFLEYFLRQPTNYSSDIAVNEKDRYIHFAW